MKHVFTFAVLLLCATGAFAQDNVVKINTTGLFFGNMPFFYERSFNDKMSGSIGLSMLIPRKVPAFIRDDNGGTAETVTGNMFGFGITPELRFYTGDEALKGFYWGPYLRYSRYSLSFPGEVLDTDGQLYDLKTVGSLRELGAGIQLGYQWLVADKVAIDWFFFGPRVAQYTIGLKVKETANNPTPVDWAAYDEDIEGEVHTLPFNSNVKVDHTNESVTVKWPFMLPAVRFGLSVGYKF